ncbi:glutathione-regulated potassium-efflux system ancillary protein KefG [Parabacteroides sp. PF5-5]|uniref:NAD(P)H-dependent oxidoreductase n=1 Tax=unclassified Parabacteroides TaxID=2649774 RepID=UPI00247405DB|nr:MULTISPECIES: NAD(P)H-dependent oxidoreductase [unclassified Parabacteroides]MDH6306676.1 glutathione-regulated potassium-efflux system ancillary protein KefG [Parabacteroides sp. PH5-39]MDH6317643.1 glutathione-regulated potassium-efflux system ancillary protein KefG [Parabacteroides sp. PF5-13]MDH6321387.1 glutathione-regulated potassium-efflux system ancillary protein KefG [Parabacteroides sp. PH5-13]MDH6325048.1 glutathione-regulated potassium-efflux system ancillary protein KefG [Paraba
MSKEVNRVSIILAHPNINESRANRELISSVKEMGNVSVYNLYEDFQQFFDPIIWKQIMLESSALVFQFPIYWMGAPYMLKKWQEEVFAELSQTPMVIGKPLQIVTTVGSSEKTYRSGGKYRFTMDEILRPYQVSAIYAGMKWQTPIIIYDMGAEEIGRNLSEGAILFKEKIESFTNASQLNVLSNW